MICRVRSLVFHWFELIVCIYLHTYEYIHKNTYSKLGNWRGKKSKQCNLHRWWYQLFIPIIQPNKGWKLVLSVYPRNFFLPVWIQIYMTPSDSDNFQFWHFPILTFSNSDTFQFWHFPILTLSYPPLVWKLFFFRGARRLFTTQQHSKYSLRGSGARTCYP